MSPETATRIISDEFETSAADPGKDPAYGISNRALGVRINTNENKQFAFGGAFSR